MPIHTDLSFGQWLKRRRRGAGLTQEELAARVGYAVATLRKIERDELRPAHQMAERLAEELDIGPEDRPAFIRFARDEGVDSAPLPTQTANFTPQPLPPAAHNLPRPLTSLVGRAAEITAVRQLLARADVCLVTLVGPGGTGKTRLALEVARSLTEGGSTPVGHFPESRKTEDRAWNEGLRTTASAGRNTEHVVYFVNLVPIRDPDLVLSTIAQAVGVKEQAGQPLLGSLKDALRDQQTLLVLDNFEQVIAAAPIVADLLAACPGLKALVTSRETLHVSGEHEYFVPPLALPPLTEDGIGNSEYELRHPNYALRVTEYEAAQLFIHRARAVQPDFAVTPDNARAMVEICHRLDGLPLAIELAAARVKLFPPQSLLAHLASRLKLLTSGPRDLPVRQQTLRGAIDWSYDLLTQAEKVLLRRLAVFPGRRSLEAATAVCSDDEGPPSGTDDGGREMGKESLPSSVLGPPSVLDGLASLVDKSLLRQAPGPDGEPRFAMLETIREYALERLRESGEEAALRYAMAEYYLRFTDTAQRHFFGPRLGVWLARVEAELNNIRAVLEWSQTGPAVVFDSGEAEARRVAMGLEIAGLLWRFWALRGHFTEGRAWLEALLTQGAHLPASARYYALHTAGNLAYDQGDHQRAKELFEACTTLSQALGKTLIVAHMRNNLGNMALMQGDFAQAETLYEEGLAAYRALGETWGASMALSNLGELARLRGDTERARARHQESLSIIQQTKDDQRRAETLYHLGLLAHDQADLDEAAYRLAEALRLYQAGANKLGIALALDALGAVARCQADYARAAELHQQALALLRELGDKRSLAYALYGWARVAQAQGGAARAVAACEEGLRLVRTLGDKGGMAVGLEGLARVAVSRHQARQAARLFGAAAAVRDTIGFPRPPVERPEYEADLAGLRTALGEAAFAAAWDAGQAMTEEQGLASALEPGTQV